MQAFFHTIFLGDDEMPRVRARSHEVDEMARMMRAEAEGEGQQGMLYVGNVIINRVVAQCLDFKGVNNIHDVIFQVQGGNFSFEAVQKGNVFYQRARSAEKRLAKQNLDYWREHPGKYALWYFNPYAPCPPTWYGQPHSGQYKQHCYYEPKAGTCDSVYKGS